MKNSLTSQDSIASLVITGGLALVLGMASVSSAQASAWPASHSPRYFETFNRDSDFRNPTHGTEAPYQYNLANLPLSGQLDAEHTPWADSYWPKQRGAFSYRWRQFQGDNEDPNMSVQERQNKFFNYRFYSKSELQAMSSDQIAMLSPMEKYGIYTGDYSYSLARKYLNMNGPNRVFWEGYCHAWSPASTQYPEPAPKTVVNADGIAIPFGSGDVKALMVANFHEARFPGFGSRKSVRVSFLNGSGCKTNVAFLYPTTKMKNGVEEMADYADTDGLLDSELENNVRAYQEGLKRVLQTNPNSITLPANARTIAYDTSLPAKARQDANMCQGVNAGAFHIAMANQLGIRKVGFQLDKTRDGQIWNQPTRGFKATITGTESPSRTSAPGTAKVALVEASLEYGQDTDYGWTFWFPTLTNLFKIDNSFLAEYTKYMKMLVRIGDEKEMKAYPYNIIGVANYKYKLDLDSQGNVIGGDWLTLDRPDTLWMQSDVNFSGEYQRLSEIYTPAQLK